MPNPYTALAIPYHPLALVDAKNRTPFLFRCDPEHSHPIGPQKWLFRISRFFHPAFAWWCALYSMSSLSLTWVDLANRIAFEPALTLALSMR